MLAYAVKGHPVWGARRQGVKSVKSLLAFLNWIQADHFPQISGCTFFVTQPVEHLYDSETSDTRINAPLAKRKGCLGQSIVYLRLARVMQSCSAA